MIQSKGCSTYKMDQFRNRDIFDKTSLTVESMGEPVPEKGIEAISQKLFQNSACILRKIMTRRGTESEQHVLWGKTSELTSRHWRGDANVWVAPASCTSPSKIPRAPRRWSLSRPQALPGVLDHPRCPQHLLTGSGLLFLSGAAAETQVTAKAWDDRMAGPALPEYLAFPKCRA